MANNSHCVYIGAGSGGGGGGWHSSKAEHLSGDKTKSPVSKSQSLTVGL